MITVGFRDTGDIQVSFTSFFGDRLIGKVLGLLNGNVTSNELDNREPPFYNKVKPDEI